jgi:hypothetical protein
VATDADKTWDCAYRIAKGGRYRRPSLGRFDDVKTEKALRRALDLTSAARQGRDLIAEEGQAHDQLAVGELIDRYLAGKVTGRLRSAVEIERTLRRVLGPIASKSAASVQRRDLARLFDDIAIFQGHERAAAKARQMIGSMYRWAIERGLVDVNPVEGTTRYTQGEPRERVLSPDEIKTLWDWLTAAGFAPSIVDIALGDLHRRAVRRDRGHARQGIRLARRNLVVDAAGRARKKHQGAGHADCRYGARNHRRPSRRR